MTLAAGEDDGNEISTVGGRHSDEPIYRPVPKPHPKDWPIIVFASNEDPVADLATDVKVLDETPYKIIWGIRVINNGPDVAYNTVAHFNGSDNLFLYDWLANISNSIDSEKGMWDIGDLAPGEIALLLLDTIKVADGPYWVDAIAVSDSQDYALENNYDIAWADAEPASASAAEKTMPAAGNHIAMALLALITIAGATISRRF